MDTKYNHKIVEQDKYDYWQQHNCFKSGDQTKKPYTIIMPPPNVTGILHIGHAFDFTLQDVIIRRKRMQGYDALYLPGMDHAGIATQAKVDAKLKSEGISRYDLGREKYLEVAFDWKKEYAKYFRKQWAALGLSIDLSKEKFTLDEDVNRTVNHVFVKLYEKGLIYQGKRIINWDTAARTALSNIEVEHQDIEGAFYHIKYYFPNSKEGIIIATTRPETMFGDTALMVHPDDLRYKDVIGKEVYIPTTTKLIPVISDDYVDKEFGTGAVKVTPAHDPNDYEVGKRHKLEMPLCMNEDGTMNELAGKYSTLDRFDCREKLVKDLEENGQLIKVEKMIHSVGHSERTGVIVEPRLSKQWFVKMKPLAEQAIKENTVNFVPKRFQKVFLTWMENVEDWCISRQLWWGHRIPVWYKGDTVYCGMEKPAEDGYVQDEDVLDTWFSSALWPFSTLGYIDGSDLFKRYYPTDCLVTAYDIIFFWVSRMIFQSIEFTNDSPFKDCFIHGLIRDSKGKKMSKSSGNGVDPLEVIDKYGTDSLRYFVSTNSTPGQDFKYEEEKVEASWNYINKIWNISRYVIMNTSEEKVTDFTFDEKNLTLFDKWILTKRNELIKTVDVFYDKYEFGEVARAIYNFTWDDFASWYIEISKLTIDNPQTKKVILYVLTTVLKLLSPFMPFVTEDIYLRIVDEVSISTSSWPVTDENNYQVSEDAEMIMDMIRKIRNIRNNYNVALSKKIDLFIKVNSASVKQVLIDNNQIIDKFVNPNELNISEDDYALENTINIITNNYTAYLPLGSLVNIEEEIKRLESELEKLTFEIKRGEKILSNPGFIQKAKPEKIEEEKNKLTKYEETYKEVQKALEELQCLKK